MPNISDRFKTADIGPGHAGDFEAAAGRCRIGDLDIDFLVIELVGPQLLAETVAGGGRGGRTDQGIEHPLFGVQMCLGLDVGALLFAHQADPDFDEIADDLLDIAADIADFGKFRRFDLDEGGSGEFGQTAGNFRLADAGRSDHQDVSSASLRRAAHRRAAGGASGCARRWQRRA